jgi:hypothetical protein
MILSQSSPGVETKLLYEYEICITSAEKDRMNRGTC